MMEKRQRRAMGKAAPPVAPAVIQELLEIMVAAPSLPEDAMQQIIGFLPQLTDETQMVIAQLLAGKLSHDFAMRFLLAMKDTATSSEDKQASLDVADERDQRTIFKLVEQWLAVIKNTHIKQLEGLRRTLAAAVGLQMMMAAAPAEDHGSWVYDAGTQYRVALKNAGVLSQAAMTMHEFSPQEVRFEGFSTTPISPVWPQSSDKGYTQTAAPRITWANQPTGSVPAMVEK